MIFVSINPFALKRFFFFFLAAIGFSCISCFGQSIFLSVKSTPYDRQMARIRPLLAEEIKSGRDNVSFGMVDLWMWRLRSIPYGFTREWKTPEETQSGDPADCKAKSVALYQLMRSHGAANVRLVIGRRYVTSRSTHAWLEWETSRGNFVLDPTLNWRAEPAREFKRDSYIPYFAYEGVKKYRAAQFALVAQN
jgi:predicted transglutaminase-like cysteine proteinase